MKPSRRLQQGPPVGREAGQRGKGSSLGVGGKQSQGTEFRGRCASKGARESRNRAAPSPSPSSSESSSEPSSARKAHKVAAASSPSSASKAHKAKGGTTKGHSPHIPKATPLSTPNKKAKMQLGSDVTPSTEVRFCPKMLRGCVCICIVLDT